MDDRRLRRSQGTEHRPRRIPARGLCARAARFRAEDRQAGGDAGRADRRVARCALPLWRARRRPRRHRRDPPRGGGGLGARRLPRLCRRPDRRRVHRDREPVPRQDADRRQGPCRPLRRPARRRRRQAARSEDHRRRRRIRRPHGRTRDDAAGARQGRDDRRQEGLRRRPRPGRRRDVRGDRGRARRNAHRAQGGLLVALPDQRRLPMVQHRRTLELRAGQIVEAPRRRIDRHRPAGAGEVQRAGRLGPPPPRPQVRRRRRDEHQLRRRLVGDRRPRHARQRRRHARQGELRAGRAGQVARRLAFRRQGDDRAGRRQAGEVHRRRSRRRRQRRAVRGRRRLGPRRLRRRADPSAARRQSQAHAGPRARPRLVLDRRSAPTSSTSRFRRRTRPGRANR